MPANEYIIMSILQGFYWFDDGMQNYLASRGWTPISRAQSTVMMNVIAGANRATDIARNLGLTRQAVHVTVNQMIEAGLVELEDDPADRRVKRIVLTKEVEPMRRDARRAIDLLVAELAQRIGEQDVRNLYRAFSKDWGPTVEFPEGEPAAAQATPRAARKGAKKTPARAKGAAKATPDGAAAPKRSRKPAKA